MDAVATAPKQRRPRTRVGSDLVMTAAEVAVLAGVSRRAIERAALDPASPYHAARISDGIAALRSQVLKLRGRR